MTKVWCDGRPTELSGNMAITSLNEICHLSLSDVIVIFDQALPISRLFAVVRVHFCRRFRTFRSGSFFTSSIFLTHIVAVSRDRCARISRA